MSKHDDFWTAFRARDTAKIEAILAEDIHWYEGLIGEAYDTNSAVTNESREYARSFLTDERSAAHKAARRKRVDENNRRAEEIFGAMPEPYAE